jgi:HD-GYP domain-containing protein (c-di-GMP phosphodiesterase class II)
MGSNYGELFENPSSERPFSEGSVYPVLIETLFSDVAPCDLFHRLRDNEYTFFARKGLPFNPHTKNTLVDHGTRHLFVRVEDVALYFDGLKERLTALVRDPTVDSRKKAEAVHACCMQTMQRVFEDPRAAFVEQAGAIIALTVDLITRDDFAARCLVQMTAHDHATYVHSTNVGIFSMALAKIFFGTDTAHDMQRLGAGFFFHDLGKCKIPFEILNKPGSLTEEERLTVNLHPEDGYRMLEECGLLTTEAGIIVLQHHEHDDGSGYPSGLKGSEIHPYARICRLADVYEALTSDRPYHQRWTTFAALKFMKEKIVVDMDREMLQHFISLFGL